MRCTSASLGSHLAATLICGLIAVLSLTGCDSDTSIPPPVAPPADASARALAGQRALDALAAGLRSGVPARAVSSVKSPGLVAAVTTSARDLGVRDVSFDYVDSEDGALGVAQRRRWGASAWVGIVAARYRLAADAGPTQMEIAVTFTTESGHARVAAIGGHGHRSTLWLDGSVNVARRGNVWVINASSVPSRRYLRRGATAVRQVRMVLPKWHGDLVIEVPRDEPQLDMVLDADQETYADIAGITTTADGSRAPRAPVHVFLNPAVFGTLEPRGAQIVLTHESTHVATRAPLTAVPTWLSEGFADYVALDHAGVPFATAAGQVLARVRRHGLPRALPDNTALAPTAHGLGATYEEAWTVCLYLSRTYGEARLVGFYDAVSAGSRTQQAFRSSFGLGQAQAVAGWRSWLGTLAGVS